MTKQLPRKQKVAIIALLVGIILVAGSFITLITIWPGTAYYTGEEQLVIEPNQPDRVRVQPWVFPPTGGIFSASIAAEGINVTSLPSNWIAYGEQISLDVVFINPIGTESIATTTIFTMLFYNVTDRFFGWHAGFNIAETPLPSVTGLWLNASGSHYSKITITVNWRVLFTPIEHGLMMGVLFVGASFIAQSLLTLAEGSEKPSQNTR